MGDIHADTGIKLHVEKTDDKELVASIIKHPDVMPGFTTPDRYKDYILKFSDRYIFYVMKRDGEISGVAVVLNVSDPIELPDTYTVDIGFYIRARGRTARDLSKMALNLFMESFKPRKLYAFIDLKKRAAYLNALWCGFRKVSITNNRIMLEYKDGRE